MAWKRAFWASMRRRITTDSGVPASSLPDVLATVLATALTATFWPDFFVDCFLVGDLAMGINTF